MRGKVIFRFRQKSYRGTILRGTRKKPEGQEKKQELRGENVGARSTLFRSHSHNLLFFSPMKFSEGDPKKARYFLQNLMERALQVIFEAKRNRPRSRMAEGPVFLILFLSFLISWTALYHPFAKKVTDSGWCANPGRRVPGHGSALRRWRCWWPLECCARRTGAAGSSRWVRRVWL